MLNYFLWFSIIFQIVFGQEKDPRCPEYNDGWAVHLPHEYDCTKFYKCDWGIPKLFECQFGLHFSVLTERCEYPAVANCNLPGSSTQTTLTTIPTTLATTTTTSPTSPPPVGSRCPLDDDPFNNPIFLPHEEDCTLFYMCFFGDLILYECSIPGTHWSVELNRCDDPEVANCQLSQETSTLITTTTSTTRPPWDPRCPVFETQYAVHHPHEYDCTLLYRCDNGKMLLERCPPPTHWSVAFDRCEWPEIAECDLNREIDDRCPISDELLFLPHEYDCRKFYTCTSGILRDYACEAGKYWNDRLKKCDENENCSLNSSTTGLTTTTTLPTTSTTTTTPTITTTTTTRTTTTTTTTPTTTTTITTPTTTTTTTTPTTTTTTTTPTTTTTERQTPPTASPMYPTGTPTAPPVYPTSSKF